LSNSSIAQIPLSERMRAPAYKACSLFSRLTVTVNPLVDVAVEFTYTLWGKISTAYFRSWDFPIPGSPRSKTWLVSLKVD